VNKNILNNIDQRFSPFYYDFTPENHNKTNKTLSLIRKPIYNTADELNKYSSIERRIDRSPVTTAHSRIYQPHEINNVTNSTNSRKVRILQRSVPNKNDAKPATVYKNTENIFYIPDGTTANAFFKQNKTLIDSLNNDKLFIYDDAERHLIHNELASNLNNKTKPIYQNTPNLENKSVHVKDDGDDEIVYVPMKKSEFLKNGGNTTQLLNKINANQNDFLVLKEKLIKKDYSTIPVNNLKKNETQIPLIVDNFQTNFKQSQENQHQKFNIPIKIQVDTETKPENKRNTNLDPIIHKRYQITPTNTQPTEKINNNNIQIENSSKVLIDSQYKNAKIKNPITGLFGFSNIFSKKY
jgi:hypothetical protein